MSKEKQNYMLIQSKRAQMPLLATMLPFYPYKWEYGSTKILVELYGEMWLATNIYAQNKSCVAQFARSIIQDISSNEIDGLVRSFMKDHPLTPIDYKYEDIPLIAERLNCCTLCLPIFQYPIKLTLEQEKEVLNIIASQDIDDKEKKVLSWFKTYCAKYGIYARLKRDIASQNDELMWHFMYIHGLYRFPVRTAIIEPPLSKRQKIKRAVLIVCGAILYLYIAIKFIYLGDEIDDWWIGMAFSLFGFIMIALPLGYFIRK